MNRRQFIVAAGAVTLAPFAGGTSAAGWATSTKVSALPGGFGIGGGPNPFARCVHGPIWLPSENAIAFSDGGNSRRLRWAPDEGYRVLHDKTNGALGTRLDNQGRFVQCEWDSGVLSRIEPDAVRSVLADGFGGQRFNRLVDLAITRDGVIFFADLRLWYGTPKSGARTSSGVYALALDGSITQVIADITRPSGLALSPDGETLYVSDRADQAIRSYPVKGPALGKGKRFLAMNVDGWLGSPSGMTTDADGNLYVGGPGGVWILNPRGNRIGLIPLTASRVTGLTIGGGDMQTLFMTSWVGVGYVGINRKGISLPTATPRKTVSGPLLSMTQTIERHDSSLDEIIAPGTQIRNLIDADFVNDLGGGATDVYGRSLEGGFWHESRNCLLFSDIGNNRRMRWSDAQGLALEQAPTGYANGATLDINGLIISCEEGPSHRLSRRLPDGSRMKIADSYQGVRFCHPNDVAIHSSGDFYMTDPWWDAGEGITRPQNAAIYRISADGVQVKKLFELGFPNGIAFSPDERILYANDSFERKLYAYPTASDGTVDISARRLVCDVSGVAAGSPDGISVDVSGNIYMGGAGGLWIIDPSGKHLGTIVHGGAMTNNIAFGGTDNKTLFIVSWVALTAVQLRVAGKPSGRRLA